MISSTPERFPNRVHSNSFLEKKVPFSKNPQRAGLSPAETVLS